MTWIADPHIWLALATLTALEVVLGVDNIIFISILVEKLPLAQRNQARLVGLTMAMLMRIALLFSLSWVMQLTTPLFSLWSHAISGRDLILLLGGLFLLAKATHEIHDKLEGTDEKSTRVVFSSYWSILLQITLLDIVFSLDSVITAIGMANKVSVMIAAVMLSVVFMMVFSGKISDFVHRHPTIKMLALSFLLLIGVMLIADGFGRHIPKGYVYFAMAFSVFVEMLNLKIRGSSAKPVQLKEPFVDRISGAGLFRQN